MRLLLPTAVLAVVASLLAGAAPAASRDDPNLQRWLIYAVKRDGSERHVLPLADGLEGATSPTLSRDGRLLAYVGINRGSEDVYVASSDGSAARRITSSGFAKTRLRFSPNGHSLSFENDVGNESDDLRRSGIRHLRAADRRRPKCELVAFGKRTGLRREL